jgi:hypothetical protein
MDSFFQKKKISGLKRIRLIMRYLKLFEGYQSESEVAKICDKYGIENWSINSDGLVDVDGSVFLNHKRLTKLPLKFGKVTGDFSCVRNKLTTLKGCPNTVDGYFSCNYNNLTSLEFCPRRVGGEFCCARNNIREFSGPKYIGDGFFCHTNPIENIWNIINPVDDRWDEDLMEFFEDCSIIHDDGQSVAIDRLNFFLEEIGRKTVEKVDGYINI